MENTLSASEILAQIIIEPLDTSLSRAAFCCGHQKVDNFFRNNAKDQHTKYRVRVYIARIEYFICGYYYLVASSHNPNLISDEAIKKFGRVASTPCIYLGMAGTQVEFQGKGIGKTMFLHAMQKTMEIAELTGVYALTLDAVDEKTAQQYERWGFMRFIAKELAMFIPLATIRKVLN